MTCARQYLCWRPQKLWSRASPKMENPLFREFLDVLCRYNLIPPLFGPIKNNVSLFSGNLGCFSPFERGTTWWWAPSSRCSRRRRALRFCLCSTTSLLVQPPNRSGGRAPRRRSPQIPAPLVLQVVQSNCNCPDSRSGATNGPCSPGPAPVVHRYPWKQWNLLLGHLGWSSWALRTRAEENKKCWFDLLKIFRYLKPQNSF